MSQVHSDQTPPPNPQVSSADVAPTAGAPAPDGTQQVPATSPPQPAASGTVPKIPDALGDDLMDFSGLEMTEADADALLAQLASQSPALAEPPAQAPQPAPVATPPAPPQPAAPAPAEPAELPGKIRVPTGSDPVTVQALNIFSLRQQQGAPISLAEADALARQVLGVAAPAAPAAPAPSPAAPETPAPAAPTSLDDQMAALTQEMSAAMDMMSAEYDPNKIAALQTRLITLATQKAVEAVKASQTQDSEAAYRESWTENFTRATAQWPELSDPTSELHLLAGALQAKAQESESHPDYQRSMTGEAGYYFAEKAAKALGKVAPAPNPAAPAASSPNAPVSSAPPLAGIFGGAGISAPSAPNPGADAFTQLMSLGAEDWQTLEYVATQAGR